MLFAQFVDLASIILRLAIGSAFMIHGYPKLKRNEQGKGWMKSMGMPTVTKIKKKYQGGLEIDITLLLAALALTFLGGGTFSIDHLIGL